MPAWLMVCAMTALPALDGLARDTLLDRAAGIHARQILRNESNATLDALRDALDETGLADPQVVPFATLGASPAELEQALAKFVERRVLYRSLTHYGLAMVPDIKTNALVAVFARRIVELPVLPTQPHRSGVGLRGRALVDAPLKAYMTPPTGRVETLAVERASDLFNIAIPFSRGPGPYVFEIVATTERGPEVAALWTFHVGGAAARSRPRAEPLALPDSRTTAEALIRRERARVRLVPLLSSRPLAEAAQQHAEDVCRSMMAVHILPGEAAPDERARRAGHRGPVNENVAMAHTVVRAHGNFMSSPSHRKNVLDPAARTIGIGLASRPSRAKSSLTDDRPRRTWCLVQLFGFDQPGR